LPVSRELRGAAGRHGWDLIELMMTGGEDYCLLLTVDPSAMSAVGRAFARDFGRELSVIGSITAEEGRLELLRDGQPALLHQHGFDHFLGRGV